jgi:hypothetical protein
VTGEVGAPGPTGATGATGATGSSGSQHAYNATDKTEKSDWLPRTLTLATAPVGQTYVVQATLDGIIEEGASPTWDAKTRGNNSSGGGPAVTCTLSFGSVTAQTITLQPSNGGTFPISLQGAGMLAGGNIKLVCSGRYTRTSNLSLNAYVVSALN